MSSMGLFGLCSCGVQLSQYELMFCRECVHFVCTSCVSTEVHTYFCPSCAHGFYRSTAFESQNRCPEKCYICPCCSQKLKLSKTSRETYIFSCGWCQWNSESIGLEAEGPIELIQHYKGLEKEQSNFSEFEEQIRAVRAAHNFANRKKKEDKIKQVFIAHRRKLKVGAAQFGRDMKIAIDKIDNDLEDKARSHYKLPSHVTSTTESKTEGKIENNEQSSSSSSTNTDLPWDPRSDTFDLTTVTTLQQRHSFLTPGVPDQMLATGSGISNKQMFPFRTPLITKVSKRCRHCEKYVMKPKTDPEQISFDRQDLAVLFVPTITMSRYDPTQLLCEKQSKIILYFKNRLMQKVNIQVRVLDNQTGESAFSEVAKNTELAGDAGEDLFGADTVLNKPKVVLSPSQFSIEAFDELEETMSKAGPVINDVSLDNCDKKVPFAFSHLSKVGISMGVTPTQNHGVVQFSLEIIVTPSDSVIANFERCIYTLVVNLGRTALPSSSTAK